MRMNHPKIWMSRTDATTMSYTTVALTREKDNWKRTLYTGANIIVRKNVMRNWKSLLRTFVTLLGGDHSDSCKLKNRRGAIIVNQDITTIMEEMVEDLALSDLALRPRQIWDQVSTEMNRRSPLWSGLSDNRVMKMVRNIRVQTFAILIFCERLFYFTTIKYKLSQY